MPSRILHVLLLATTISCFMLASCQVLEQCRTDAFPPIKNDEIPVETVNLDLPPEQRWRHIVEPRKQKIKLFVRYLKRFIPNVMFNMITNFLSRGIKKFPEPYNKEIIGIADSIDESLGDVLACNIFYELEKVCTSIVAQDDGGNIYHGRNLDLGALLGWDSKKDTWKIAELLRPLTISVDFKSKGKTIFRTVQFAGTVGVFTGVAPGKFSFSLNSRSPSHFLGGPLSVISWILSSSNNRQFASILARNVLQTSKSYQDAYKQLSKTPLLAPVYYILAGPKPNQGVIISRSETSSVKPLKLSKKNSLLVQTNYDHWNSPPFYDNRRRPAKQCMSQLKKAAISSNIPPNYYQIMYNVLSTIPIRNKATIYSTLMFPKTGNMISYKRNCPGDCYPW